MNRLKRLLRSPRVIVGEVLALAAAGVPLTLIPQSPGRLAARRFALEHPAWAPLVKLLSLDRILASSWFLALLAAAGASLLIVIVERVRLLGPQWRAPLTGASFRSANYRREIVRDGPPRCRTEVYRTTGKIGLLGSPLFHLGLLVLVAGGGVRALFHADGFAEVIEGETLPAEAAAFPEQERGPLAAPVRLAEPLRLDRVEADRYPTGVLRGMAVRASMGKDLRPVAIAVNAPLELSSGTVYVSSIHGPAAILSVDGPAPGRPEAVLLRDTTDLDYEGSWVGEGVKVLLRVSVLPHAPVPRTMETRVLRDGALLFVGDLAPGQVAPLPAGSRLTVHGLRQWTVLRNSRDPSLPWMVAGFSLIAVGVVLMFGVTRVDTAIVSEGIEGGKERLVVALRAGRFAPLYRERFERLVAEAERVGEAPGRGG